MTVARSLLTPTIITLPVPGAVQAMTLNARRAMLEFSNGALFWDKRGLAHWLLESYATVAQELAREARPRPVLARPISEPALVDVMIDAGSMLLGALRLSLDGRSAGASAWRMIRTGALAPCEDHEGRERGWVPVSRPRMRLRDRVLSLWAADYLANEDVYATSLAICRRCGRAEFDALARARGTCLAHASGHQLPQDVDRESETRIRIRQG